MNLSRFQTSKLSKLIYIFGLLSLLLTVLFGVSFLKLPSHKQVNRLIVILLTFFIISRPNYLPCLASNRLLVTLGDISYSVYLIHWPLITLFRYYNIEQDGIEISAGLFLLICSILAGLCVERFFKCFLKHVTNWPNLIVVILIGYCASGYLMLLLEKNAVRIDENQKNSQLIEDSISLAFQFPLNSTNKTEVRKMV
jgi:hypothetical protein